MTLAELVLALQLLSGVGDVAISHMVRRLTVLRLEPGDLQAMSDTDAARILDVPTARAASLLSGVRSRAPEARELAAELGRLGVHVVTICDAAYPACVIRWLPDPPPAFYYLGSLDLISGATIAVLNSNGTSEEGIALTDRATSVALDMGATVVAGHNRTEYQRPALLARRRGHAVCYVLDRGILPTARHDWLDGLFPASRVWPKPTTGVDLVVSPFGPAAPWFADSGRRRDAIVDALATAAYTSHLKRNGVMSALVERRIQEMRPVAWLAGDETPPNHVHQLGVDVLTAAEPDSVRAWLATAWASPERKPLGT